MSLDMRLGITASLTDRDMSPAALARAAEDRGFDSLFLPEHTHLPLRTDQPPGLVEGVRAEDYRRTLCPLVSLSTAVSATEHLRLGIGILLVAQHDPIVLAKQIATLDHLLDGRVVLGIGFGCNRAEAEDHGVDFANRHALVREDLLCMQALWTEDQASVSRRIHRPSTELGLAETPSTTAAPGTDRRGLRARCSARSLTTQTDGCPSAGAGSARRFLACTAPPRKRG
jgi:alkanesulfonate monooxygenase SsuD/methylene tetrahydromethanopterin reductase-like flavin-dependent oxidoreductase (luciferase family)